MLVAERTPKNKRWDRNTVYEYGATVVSPLDIIPTDLHTAPNSVFAVVEGRSALFYKFIDFELPYNDISK